MEIIGNLVISNNIAGSSLQLTSNEIQSLGTDENILINPNGAGLAVFGNAIRLGNTADTTEGNIRWTGTDLEVYKSSAWSSLTSGGGASVLNDLTDVTIASLADDQVLQYNSGTGVWENATISTGGASSLNDLSDVTITTAASGQFLGYDGTSWINSALPSTAINDLTDVTITSATSGNFLKYNGTSWVNTSTIGNLNDISDVNLTTAGTGAFLQYDGTNWIDSNYVLPTTDGTIGQILTTDGAGALSFSDNSIDNLSNTNIATPTSGQIIKYDNIAGEWINADPNALPAGSSYFGVSLSATQTAGLADGDPVRLDTLLQNSSDVSINTGTYTLTLPAGVWILQAAISTSFSSSSGVGRFQWYNVTDATYVGNQTFVKPSTNGSNSASHHNPYAVVSITEPKDFQLRIVNPTALSAIFGFSSGTDYRSQAVGYTTVSHITTAPEYAFIQLTNNQTTNLTVGSRVLFDAIDGTSGITNATGVISLKAGYTYELSAQVVPSFSSSGGDLRLQWYDITNATLIGSPSLIFPTTRTNNNPLNSESRAIVTPLQDIDVELQIINSTAVLNINGLGFTFASIKTIEGGNAPKVYSTSEQATMDRWVDGKTVYRKSFEISANFASGVTTPHNITGLETLVNYSCNIHYISLNQWYFANTWGGGSETRSRVENTDIYIQTNISFSGRAVVTIEYTKT